jgi:plasmid maintenance system antidote protein VapI
MLDKPLYTKAELLEAIRQVLFTGDPELYERGGIHGMMPGTNTGKRAEEAFRKYVTKSDHMIPSPIQIARDLFAIHKHHSDLDSKITITVYEEADLLKVLQGWGLPDPDWEGNAVEHAKKVAKWLILHPSTLIQKFMDDSEMAEYQLGQHLGMDKKQLDRLLIYGGAMSRQTAKSLEVLFGTPAADWLQMQDEYLDKIQEVFNNEKP